MTQYILIFMLLCLGLSGVMYCKNLMRKLMALNIMQVAIILFFIALAYKKNGLVPIAKHVADIDTIINPLPHAMMLTAIVVSVATTGLALSLLIRIFRAYGTIEEDQLMRQLEEER